MRRQRDSRNVRQLLLVGAVIIHLPDFLGASAASTHEVNLRLGDALNATAQPEDNLVGEPVGDDACIFVTGRLTILLAQHLRLLLVLHIEQPALHRQRSALHRRVAEG